MALPLEIPEDAPRVGDGRYALLTRLGEGGMAVVYGAWDLRRETWRAVKVLLPEYARKRSVRKRFAREAEAMMGFRNPHLVRVLDIEPDQRLPYLVMELVPGGSLQEWALRHGPMPPRLAAECGIQICEGLKVVHAAGMVHRDVKPQNVLIDHDGALKLTDFGVAQMDGGDTRTGVAMGTLGYMAPEQLADSKSVDARSDVYSLGASLYMLLTHSTVRDLFRIADDPTRVGGMHPALVPILQGCLQYERDDRYATAAEVQEALLGVLDELPETPHDTPGLPRRVGEQPGVPAGEFTELKGMLTTTLPTFTDEVTNPPPPLPDAQEPLPIEDRSQEPPPPEPLPPPPRPPPEMLADDDEGDPTIAARVASTAVSALLLIGFPIVLVALLAPVLLGAGRSRVVAAATEYQAAQRVLEDRIRDADALPDELLALGLQATPVQQAYAAYLDEDDVDSALDFVEAAHTAARPLSVSSGGRGHRFELARQRVQRLEWAAEQLEEAHAGWVAASTAPLGRLAVATGLAPAAP